jgi:pilus assembly protein CpaC
MKQRFARYIVAFFALAAVAGLPVLAEGAARVSKTVELTVGRADTVDLGSAVSDVLVANPAIADVGTLRSSRLYVVGKQVGDTNVLAFDDAGNQLADISVRVSIDEKSLRDSLRKFFPDEKVSVNTVKQEIVLSGEVSTPARANQIRDLAGRFAAQANKPIVDLMTVQGEQQVMLKVKVVEANRSVLREYGISGQAEGRDSRTNGLLGTIAGTGLTSTPFGTGSILFERRGSVGPFSVDLSALEREGLVNTLAEPNLTAISGETAGFLAGGEFPVPTGRDQDGNVTIEFKQFGVSLNFTPTVLSPEQISLQLSTEVSTRSDEDGLTLVNTRIPGLSVRRAQTTVQMGSGGTVMIAGLIKSDTLDSLNGLPGIKDVPILGELFKSKSFSRNETELVILVTPYIVKPYGLSQAVTPETAAAATPAGAPLGSDASVVNGTVAAAPVSAVTAQALPATPKLAQEVRLTSQPVETARPGKLPEQGLSQPFLRNLRAVYGARVPQQRIDGGGAYGYIVD